MSEKINYSAFEKAVDDVREATQDFSDDELALFIEDLKTAEDLEEIEVDKDLIREIIVDADEKDLHKIVEEIISFAEEIEVPVTYNLLLKILQVAKGQEGALEVKGVVKKKSKSEFVSSEPFTGAEGQDEAGIAFDAAEAAKLGEGDRYADLAEQFEHSSEAADRERMAAEIEGDLDDKYHILAKNFPDKDESSYSHVDFSTRDGLSRSVLNDAGIDISLIEGLPNEDIRPFIFNSHGLSELRESHIQPLSLHLKMNLYATSEVDIVAASVLIGQAIKKGKEKNGDFREILSFEGESSLETLNRLYEYVYSEEPEKFDDAKDAAEVANLPKVDRYADLAKIHGADDPKLKEADVAAEMREAADGEKLSPVIDENQ